MQSHLECILDSTSQGEIPFPIPHRGNKRKLASTIITCFPKESPQLYEPFAGSAAVSLAVALHHPAVHLNLNDTDVALVRLREEIIKHPMEIAETSTALCYAQLTQPRPCYDDHRREMR
ncbi:MAG: DNA adenine methylase [Ferrimicrobium acidiphilum]